MLLKLFWRGALAGAAGMLALLGIGALLVVVTGAYDVAADDPHETPVAWALTTTMRNSVQNRASEIDAPAFTADMIAAGGKKYKAMCEHCHGGVGATRADWAHGMRPKPPALATVADRWKAREVFWIARHGIRMTGMPSFGGSHDERTLWSIAAFVRALPTMSGQDYATLTAERRGTPGESDGHGH